MSGLIKIILIGKNIRYVGSIGDVASVKPGYAAYLVRQGYAVFATKAALRDLESQKSEYVKKLDDSLEFAKKQKEALSDVDLITLKVRSTAEGKLFGSVTTKDISREISERYKVGLSHDNLIISGAGAIKTLGQYKVEIFFCDSISHSINVKVVSDQEL
ncbi:50S ribosomal protein L9 [Anaplasmataceae bacterium AB001_6]|nr:50S ribosomal protein L9 [Anaplasmataceae bacterium AB001_6]